MSFSWAGNPRQAQQKHMAVAPIRSTWAVDEQLTNYMTDSYLQILEQAANELKPAIILFGQNQTGLDVAPRLAFRLKAGV